MMRKFMHPRVGALGLVAFTLGTAASASLAQDSLNYVMADFESNYNSTPIGGFWYDYDDAGSPSAENDTLFGNSVRTSIDPNGMYDSLGQLSALMFGPGRSGDSGSHSKRMSYAFGDRMLSCGASCSYPPYVGWGLTFTTNFKFPDKAMNMDTATAISFWAKSDSDTVKVNFTLIISDTNAKDAADYSTLLKIGPAWKKYTISLGSDTPLEQPSWSAKKAFDKKRVTGIGFGFSKGDNPIETVNGISVDDVVIEHWQFVEPPDEVIPEEPISIRTTRHASQARRLGLVREGATRARVYVLPGASSRPVHLNGRAALR